MVVGLLLPTYGDRLIHVGPLSPEILFTDIFGVQHTGSVVEVENINLTFEQLEFGITMGYNAQTKTAIIHPIYGPEQIKILADSAKAAELLDTERPLLRVLVTGALQSLAADQTQRAADVTALNAASTLAAAKPIIANMLSREQLRINIDIRVLRALAGLAKVLIE